MKKQIVSETKNYQPSTVDELLLDDAPKVNSFNGITSDGVARAIAGASGEVPQVTENDNGKVLTAIYDEGGAAVEWAEVQGGGSVTTVDKAFTVGVNGTGLPITVDCANASETTSTIPVEVAGVAGLNNMFARDAVFFAAHGLDLTNTVTITFPEDLGNASASGSFLQNVAWYQGAPGAVTDIQGGLSLYPGNQVGNVLKAGTYTVNGSAPIGFTPDGICLYYTGEGEAVTQINADIAAAASSLTLSTPAEVVTGYTIKPYVLPAATFADEGKVLTADFSGAAAWAAVPKELPASAVGDAGKVLTVNSNGRPRWAAKDIVTVNIPWNNPSSDELNALASAVDTAFQNGQGVIGIIQGTTETYELMATRKTATSYTFVAHIDNRLRQVVLDTSTSTPTLTFTKSGDVFYISVDWTIS